ncbi:LysR family transcriptional regulator [Archangium minus]|uniref:LysR family transcriptional regulator n=1 Tax=Archangium minus TaxID=83450 RepID=A0ABY9X7V9_9BACT|nr:LysR family transcriptional regulator [Archangium minus]
MHRSGLIELETVLAVARHGSFRAAAKQLGMSTSAVSSAVAGLETRLKARLFHRTTRSVALTEAGQRYVQRIGPAVAEIRGANEEINSQPEAPSGTLRINAPGDAVKMIFEPLLLEYLHRYPRMKLDIVSESRLIDIVADGFDAGIRLAEAVPQDMVAVPLSKDLRMVVVGSPAYFAEHGKPRTPDDLTGHAAIRMRLAHGGLYRWELERRGEALEIDLPPRLILSDLHTLRQAARAGIGLAFLSEWHIADDLASGRLVTVLDDWCPSFPGLRLYYPRHRYVPAGLKALVELIREKTIGHRAAR